MYIVFVLFFFAPSLMMMIMINHGGGDSNGINDDYGRPSLDFM